MKRSTTLGAIATVAALLAACESAPRTLPPGATKLPPRELRLFFSDATFTGTSATTGSPYEAYYATDGTVRMRSGPSVRDTGRYRIADDGAMCVRFPLVRSGREVCATFFREGPKVYRVDTDGTVHDFDETRLAGNPQNL